MADYISHEAPAHEAAALPVMVPQKLIGRDAILGQVYTRLRENKPVVLAGAAGVGKTALAATLAAAYTEQPGGVLWLNVDNATVEQLIVRVGRAYEVAEITNSDRPMGMIGAVASTLTQHKPLIVLDGRLNEEATRTFIERCADNLPILLVGTPFETPDWATFTLEPLETTPASTLFKQIAGSTAAPDTDVEKLVETMRGVPMALVLAAATVRATKQTPAQYLNTLAQIPGHANADPSLVALTAAFRSLNSALQGLFLMMGATFLGEASAELLSTVGNAPQATIEQAMKILAHQQLVEVTQRYGSPYYRLHPLAHKFAQTLAGAQRLTDLQGKMRDALVDYARRYSSNLADNAYDRLSAMMDNFLAAASWSTEKNELEVANQFATALMQADDFVSERGYIYELLRLRRMAATSTSAFPASDLEPRPTIASTAVPITEDDSEEYDEEDFDEDEDEEAFDEDEEDEFEDEFDDDEEEDDEDLDDDDEADEDDEEEAIAPPAFLSELFQNDQEDDDLAYEEDEDDLEDIFIPEIPEPDEEIPAGDIAALRTALMAAKQSDDHNRQIELLEALGKAQIDQNLENEAIATYTELTSLYEDEDDDDELLEGLDTLSALMVKTDNAQPAILHANRGIELAQQLDDDDTRMHMYTTLGDARQQLGESIAAETAYGNALEIARNNGDTQNEAIILYKLGFAQLDSSDPEGASATWEQALSLFRQQDKHDYEGKVLGGLGTAYGEQDRWSEAVRFHTSALYIAREVSDTTEELLQLNNLAYAAVQAEDLGQAVLRYRQALHLAYEHDDREGIVSTIVDLAGLLVRSPRHLAIAQLLVEDASRLEPYDRDVNNLKTRIAGELAMQQAQGIELKPVNGTSHDYAANAYALLDG